MAISQNRTPKLKMAHKIADEILKTRSLKMKCIACGSAALVEGTVKDTNGASVSFNLSDVPTLKAVFGVGSRKVRAYGCVHCHNLQFAVAFSEKDFERYQQFEGEQPDVLERINSDPKKLSS